MTSFNVVNDGADFDREFAELLRGKVIGVRREGVDDDPYVTILVDQISTDSDDPDCDGFVCVSGEALDHEARELGYRREFTIWDAEIEIF